MLRKNHCNKFINRKRYPVLYKIDGRKTIISVISQKLT